MNPSRYRTSLSFSQRISARMSEAESLCLRLRSVLLSSPLSGFTFPVELLARECLSNAVIHGSRSRADKFVLFVFCVGRKWIRLEISDEGPGFAWREAPKRRRDAGASCGYGLQICALYAQRIRFNRRGNKITLWIWRGNPREREI